MKNERDITPSDLKTVLTSHRANMFVLSQCRVLQKDGRVVYLTSDTKEDKYYNIPIANTTFILLGTGTSITCAAMRYLSESGVIVGFCGNGGTPLLAGEDTSDILWHVPQSEYRPTEYLQGWLKFWNNENSRLAVAKEMQTIRIQQIIKLWGANGDRDIRANGFSSCDHEVKAAMDEYYSGIQSAPTVQNLLTKEAHFTKRLYAYAARKTNKKGFKRDHKSDDATNGFLSHGNYLAYGLAATALWVLGIPYGFPVMHGKTRRGALVFDVADLIKDSLILPLAFIYSEGDAPERVFRETCINKFADHDTLSFLFNTVKDLSKYAEYTES